MEEDDNQALSANVFPFFSGGGVQGNVKKLCKCNSRGRNTTLVIPYCVRLMTRKGYSPFCTSLPFKGGKLTSKVFKPITCDNGSIRLASSEAMTFCFIQDILLRTC